jgi:hypothetical protein
MKSHAAAFAIICATSFPVMAQNIQEPFDIYTNGPVSPSTIRQIAGSELDKLAAKINPKKYYLVIESSYISAPNENSFHLVKVGAIPHGTLERPNFYVQHRVDSPMNDSDAKSAILAGIKGLAEEI